MCFALVGDEDAILIFCWIFCYLHVCQNLLYTSNVCTLLFVKCILIKLFLKVKTNIKNHQKTIKLKWMCFLITKPTQHHSPCVPDSRRLRARPPGHRLKSSASRHLRLLFPRATRSGRNEGLALGLWVSREPYKIGLYDVWRIWKVDARKKYCQIWLVSTFCSVSMEFVWH